MKSEIFLMLSFVGISVAVSQPNMGPKLAAMGNSGAAVADCWSTAANPSLLSKIDQIAGALNYQKLLVDLPISNQAFSFIYPFNQNAIGLNCQRYGTTDYHEIRVSGILSKKFGDLFALAFRGNYHQVKITGYGSARAFSADFGIAFMPSKVLSIGLYLNNISPDYKDETLPSTVKSQLYTGIAYALSDWATITYNINYARNRIENTFGLEYWLAKNYCIRGGLSTNPFNKFFGFGLALQKLQIDLAITRTAFLNDALQIGIGYAF